MTNIIQFPRLTRENGDYFSENEDMRKVLMAALSTYPEDIQRMDITDTQHCLMEEALMENIRIKEKTIKDASMDLKDSLDRIDALTKRRYSHPCKSSFFKF